MGLHKGKSGIDIIETINPLKGFLGDFIECKRIEGDNEFSKIFTLGK